MKAAIRSSGSTAAAKYKNITTTEIFLNEKENKIFYTYIYIKYVTFF